MNAGNQRQSPMERLSRYGNPLEEGGNARSHRVQVEAVMQALSFGPFRVIPYARLLELGGSPVRLGSRAFDILCLLISRPGEVVSKSELMAKAWPNVTVGETNLRVHITLLRRALGDRQRGVRYVVTVPGRGYCFVACVNREASPLKQSVEDNTPNRPPPVWADWQLA
jgi:DNA-binding winged helix-turn-helix (wHTH) protein